MQLAFALNVDNIINIEKTPPEWRQAFARRDEVYTLAARVGLDSVELKTFYRDADALDTVISRFRAAGTGVTFHKEIYFPGHSRSFLSEYRQFIATCQRQGIDNPLVVIHGTEGRNLYALEHRQATIESINLLTGEFPRIRFAVEVSRYRRRTHQACQSYEDALAILRRCHSKSVGVCWNLGNCHFNSLCREQPFMPPPAFLKRVFNVHIHEVVGGEAHHFPHPGGVPLDEALAALRGVEYDGPLTLEVSPEQAKAGKNFSARLGRMVREVRELARMPVYKAVV